MKHIVFITREYVTSTRAGGIASYVRDMAIALKNKDIKITVIAASDDTRKEETYYDAGVKIILMSGGDFFIHSKERSLLHLKKLRIIYRFVSYRLKVKRAVKELMENEGIDLIEVPEYGAESIFLWNLDVPIVVRLHTPMMLDRSSGKKNNITFKNFYKYWLGLLEIILVKKAKNITSCSESLKNWFVNEIGITPNKIKVIHNPIDISSFSGIITNINAQQKYIITFIGTVSEEKGISDLIEAVYRLRKCGSNVHVQLIGKMGAYAVEMQKRANNAGWDWCRFQGKVPRDKLKELISASDIICLPSWWEAFGLVCTEAMSLGAIVLGSDSGGMAEIINDGVNGFLVKPKDPSQLAEKIRLIINMPKQIKQEISDRARETVNVNFSTEIIVNNMIKYYNTLFI